MNQLFFGFYASSMPSMDEAVLLGLDDPNKDELSENKKKRETPSSSNLSSWATIYNEGEQREYFMFNNRAF